MAGWMAGLMLADAATTPRLRFDFTGADPASQLPWSRTAVRESGWAVEGWRLGPGILRVAARDDRLAFSVTSGAEPGTLAESLSAGAHLSLRLAPSNGALDLSANRIRFTIRREAWHAPLQYAVSSSLDNHAVPLFVSPLLDNADDATNTFTFLLPAVGFGRVTGPFEFRIHPFAARHSGHAASLTAFSIEPAVKTVTLSLSADPGGTVTTEPRRVVFEAGETVTVVARPDPGFRFIGWRGAPAGSGNPAVLTLDADTTVGAVFAPGLPPRMDLGGNLEALTDWTTAWVFRDCFKLARTWMTRNDDGSGDWDSAQSVPSDGDGWPRVVPFDPPGAVPPQRVHTLMPLQDPGTYTVRCLGTGRLLLIPPNGGARQTIDASGGTTVRRLEFLPTPEDRTLGLEIERSSASDPIRGIEILGPGQDSDTGSGPFHPAFLDTLSPYRLLRFMDWLQTNAETGADSTGRTTPASYTQTRPGGVAHEFVVRLANQTRKDPWICIRHDADDEQVRQIARIYRDQLDPELEVYVEYSNETWNGAFPQTTHVQERGLALGLDADRWRAGQRFVARRSGEIFGIFAREYGAERRHRFVAVLATQAAGAQGVTDLRVAAIHDPSINPSAQRPDALAIAPYFGVNFEPGEPVPTAEAVVTTLSQRAITEAVGWTRAHRDIAAAQGWRLVCYEGGQHFVGIFGAENNEALTSVLHSANRDPRMQDRYQEYLASLESVGVDLFAHFTHIGEWSKWGSWGALEDQRQPAASAPKWRALLGWSARLADHRDPGGLTSRGGDGGWILRLGLRPGRRYSVQSSTTLSDWVPVEGMSDLRGDGIVREIPLGIGPERAGFWRILTHE